MKRTGQMFSLAIALSALILTSCDLGETAVNVPLKYDRTKYGWTLMEDVSFDGKPLLPEIVEYIRPGEVYLDGDVMRQRAKELGANLGQRHLEYLEDHQELIPKEWRKYYLVATGTVWRVGFGDKYRYFTCLRWDGYDNRWWLDFGWLGHEWGGLGRIVSLYK